MARDKNVTPAIPFIQLYDAGTQTFTNAGEFHTWDTISFKTSNFNYVSDDDRVIIKRDFYGYYEIIFECSFTKSGSGFGMATSQIYLNGVAVSGTKAVACSYDTGQGQAACACMTLHYVIYLKRNDYIQIKTTASVNSLLSGVETSRLLIRFVSMHGWNNEMGGKLESKGGVFR